MKTSALQKKISGLVKKTSAAVRKFSAFWLLSAVAAAYSCANPGSGPDGGPYDETPPHIVAMQPERGGMGVKSKRVTLWFDEPVKIDNAAEKITISPPQKEIPTIKAVGRKITVTLQDTLQENTTYTIDFSDAIEDATEGNPLGNFTYYFTTGTQLDTLEVAGNVLQADNLEPIKGILVGLHPADDDSAFVSKPFSRVARTDSRGHFSIKGIAPGKYKVYALKDLNEDYKYSSPAEMLAFLETVVEPSSFSDVRFDTLWRDTVAYDSIRKINYTHFIPDDLVLRAFTELRTPRNLLKTKRDVPESFTVFFTAPSAHIPVIEGLNFDAKNAFLEERTAGNDTITYWLRDTTLLRLDTLQMVYTYEVGNDSTTAVELRSDTLELTARLTFEKRAKQRAEELEKWQKEQEKNRRRGRMVETTPPQEYLETVSRRFSSFAPDENPVLEFSAPPVSVDTAAFHLLLAVNDSTWREVPFRLDPVAHRLRQIRLFSEWRNDQKYELKIDSAAIRGVTGLVNKAQSQKFSIGKAEEYGTLFLIVPDADSCAIAELLQDDTKVVKQAKVEKGRASFYYLKPGSYFLRIISDENGDGKASPGCFADRRQPEAVYYFPDKVEIKANWDVEQTWKVSALPLTAQKPSDLVRQKADAEKKTAHQRNIERLKERK